jgi:hypothetical protein
MGSVSMMGRTAIFKAFDELLAAASVGPAVPAFGAQAERTSKKPSNVSAIFRFIEAGFLSENGSSAIIPKDNHTR